MAATLALAIGGALLVGARYTSWVLEGLLGGAVMAVVFLRFCPGSYLYYVLERTMSTRQRDLATSSATGGSGTSAMTR